MKHLDRDGKFHWLRAKTQVVANECWIWTAALDKDGYAVYTGYHQELGTSRVHRLLYLLSGKEIAEGLELDHTCRNKACVNPAHMEPVTNLENLRRQGAAITHCKRGHEFTEENTYIASKGKRVCRTCHRMLTYASKVKMGRVKGYQ